MARIKITTEDNKVYEIKGRVSFAIQKTEEEDYITEGSMTIHHYIEDIKEIETDRYILEDIDVIKESFGSNDFDIFYHFTIGSFIVKGGLSNLSESIINKIQKEEYKNDDSNLWEGDE